MLLLQNFPPNLVDCHRHHRPLSPHRSPPRRLTCRIIHRPPSTQQHCRPRHCCNPLLTSTALVVLSVSHCPLSSRCLPAAAIVAATPSLLRLLSPRLLLSALVTPSYCQRYNIAPAVVAMTPQCSVLGGRHGKGRKWNEVLNQVKQ